MKHLVIGLAISLITSLFANAQIETPIEGEVKVRESYIDMGFGTGRGSLRDFGTSPLVYSGRSSSTSVGFQSIGEHKELGYGFTVSSGSYSNIVDNEIAVSSLTFLNLHYMELFKLDVFGSDKWNLKAGGLGSFSGDIRINPSLQNAATGYELFMNLMLSGKITRAIDRKTDVRHKIWFIRYTTKARKRNLSYQVNLGLINHNVRNGYTYLDQKSLLNELPIFGDYQINTFNGFRMNSELAYTRYMASNKNALRLSYCWDMIKTNEDYHSFEFATHTIKISLMYHLKTKQK